MNNIIYGVPAYSSASDYILLACGFAFWLSSFLFIDWLEKRSRK
jgi:hypothetical protein